MTFFEAIRHCFVNYANFYGRASRPEFWWFILFLCIGSAIASVIDWTSLAVFQIGTFVPAIAVGARRLHDTNRSGWWQLLWLAPLGLIVVIVFWAQEAKPEKT
jgi:uncharacterized membrane protein YhaH (DUF805 family)